MKKEVVQIRVDSQVKKKANKIFSAVGVDFSTGVRMYLNQVILRQGIPFSVLTENGFSEEKEAELLRELAETKKMYERGELTAHTTVASLKKDLLS